MPRLQRHGARLDYIRAGTGPAVLLIQGAGTVGECWRPQIDALADRYTLVAFDNRGMGGSTLERRASLTIDDMALDALAIMDAEGLHRVHVVGHSMGGLIGQALALRARDRVTSLALLCTFVRGREAARLSAAALATAVRMRIGTKRMRRNAFLELVMPREYLRSTDRERLAGDLARLYGYDLASQPSFAMRQVRAMARYDNAARWRDLTGIPTIVISATHDRIAPPAYGRALVSLVGTAHFVEIPGAAHAVTIQCADEINALLTTHFTAAEAERDVTSSSQPGPVAAPRV